MKSGGTSASMAADNIAKVQGHVMRHNQARQKYLRVGEDRGGGDDDGGAGTAKDGNNEEGG